MYLISNEVGTCSVVVLASLLMTYEVSVECNTGFVSSLSLLLLLLPESTLLLKPVAVHTVECVQSAVGSQSFCQVLSIVDATDSMLGMTGSRKTECNFVGKWPDLTECAVLLNTS